jgi:Protein tyrosine phosphatase-like protein, PTPLA
MHSRLLTLIIFHLIQRVFSPLQHFYQDPIISYSHRGIYMVGIWVALLGLCVQFLVVFFYCTYCPSLRLFTTSTHEEITLLYDHVIPTFHRNVFVRTLQERFVPSFSTARTLFEFPAATASFVTYYLVAYNILSTIGWGYILVSTLIHVFNLDGSASTPNATTPRTASSAISNFLSSLGLVTGSIATQLPTWLQPVYLRSTSTFAQVGTQTAFIQTFALLEVVHSLLGWVRSPLQTTAMQVASRLFLVWGITEQFENVRSRETHVIHLFTFSHTGSYKSFIHLDGTCLVLDRSNPLFLLRLQPPRIRALRPSIPPIYHVLCPVPCRCILRGLPHLCHSPRLVTHPGLAGLG